MLDKARIWEGIPGCGLSDGTDGCSRSCALTATFEAALLKARGNGSTTVSTQHSVEERVNKLLGTRKHVCTCLHIWELQQANGSCCYSYPPPLFALTNCRPHLAVSANRTCGALHIGINSRSHENTRHEHAIPTAESRDTCYHCARLESDET